MFNKPFDLGPTFIWKTILFSFIFILITINFFAWGRELNLCGENATINHEIWGTFGDFIGGILGTLLALLSAFLMYWTFSSQRELTRNSDRIQTEIARTSRESQELIADENNRLQAQLTEYNINQAELQRFNELFFSLLNIYREAVSNLVLENNGKHENLFDRIKDSLIDGFKPSPNYGTSVNKAVKRYTKIYLEDASLLAPVFRTLYRIMELIDTSKISDNEKNRYAKIIRAQLCESELFCLRYNCMTPYGENFIENINKYHLLKHLPIMSLLEFKDFKKIIKEPTYLALNIIFNEIWRSINQLTLGKLRRENGSHIIYQTNRYTLYLDMTLLNTTIVGLNIKTHQRNTDAIMKPFSHLSYKEIELLLKYFIQEVYRYSNFKMYNEDNGNLKISTDITHSTGSYNVIAVAKSQLPLRVSHHSHDEKYGI